MGWPGGAQGHDVPHAHRGRALAMGGGIRRVVGAQHRVASAQQRDAAGGAEAQPLQRGEGGFGAPEFRWGGPGVDLAAEPLPGVAVVAPGIPDHRVAGMGMGVNQAGQDQLARGVDLLRRVMGGQHLGLRTDGDDPAALDGDGALGDEAARGVHGQDRAAVDDEVGHQEVSILGRSVTSSTASRRIRKPCGRPRMPVRRVWQ